MTRRTRTSGIAGSRRRNRIAGQFSAVLVETLESPAWQVLSLSERRILDRLRIELGHHGGQEASRLCVTYDDFQRYGIRRHSIAPAIRALVALGFLRITQEGRAGNAEFRRPTFYRLTFINSVDDEPTHEWRRIRTVAEARAAAQRARAEPAKQNSSVRIGTNTGVRNGTTNRQSCGDDSYTTAQGRNGTTIYISGGWSGGSGGGDVCPHGHGHAPHRGDVPTTNPANEAEPADDPVQPRPAIPRRRLRSS
jgi:hypothetical protein